MPTDDRTTLPADHEPLNREQRRHPERIEDTEANPAFGRGGDDQGSYTGRPDQDVTKLTGAGTGGATEDKGRMSEHEGRHFGNVPNG